eukprot:scaffold3962_cov122-Isochrysis_galbana.AAC.12
MTDDGDGLNHARLTTKTNGTGLTERSVAQDAWGNNRDEGPTEQAPTCVRADCQHVSTRRAAPDYNSPDYD